MNLRTQKNSRNARFIQDLSEQSKFLSSDAGQSYQALSYQSLFQVDINIAAQPSG